MNSAKQSENMMGLTTLPPPEDFSLKLKLMTSHLSPLFRLRKLMRYLQLLGLGCCFIVLHLVLADTGKG